MAYTYQRINDLPQLTSSLDKSDMLLVARSNDTKTRYMTYSVMLSALSAAAWESCKDKKFQISVLTNIGSCSGENSKVAAANLTYRNYLSVTGLQTSYNTLNTAITNISSAVNSQIQNITNTVNNYKTAALTNVNASSYVYCITTKTDPQYDLTACGYFDQSKSSISCSQKQMRDHPIIHKVTKDSIIVVTSYSNNFYAFVSPYANGKDKQQLHNNIAAIQTSQWNCIGHTQKVDEPVYLGSCKAGTYLFFWIGANVDKANATIKPKTTSDFGNSDKIQIREFSNY